MPHTLSKLSRFLCLQPLDIDTEGPDNSPPPLSPRIRNLTPEEAAERAERQHAFIWGQVGTAPPAFSPSLIRYHPARPRRYPSPSPPSWPRSHPLPLPPRPRPPPLPPRPQNQENGNLDDPTPPYTLEYIDLPPPYTLYASGLYIPPNPRVGLNRPIFATSIPCGHYPPCNCPSNSRSGNLRRSGSLESPRRATRAELRVAEHDEVERLREANERVREVDRSIRAENRALFTGDRRRRNGFDGDGDGDGDGDVFGIRGGFIDEEQDFNERLREVINARVRERRHGLDRDGDRDVLGVGGIFADEGQSLGVGDRMEGFPYSMSR